MDSVKLIKKQARKYAFTINSQSYYTEITTPTHTFWLKTKLFFLNVNYYNLIQNYSKYDFKFLYN